jgi:outer membrane receptor protein involved in Fe transport
VEDIATIRLASPLSTCPANPSGTSSPLRTINSHVVTLSAPCQGFLTGYLPPYFMNNVTLEKQLSFRWADLSLKGSINNLFDEEYLSVLSRPMPGINFEIFIGITPKFGKNKNSKR